MPIYPDFQTINPGSAAYDHLMSEYRHRLASTQGLYLGGFNSAYQANMIYPFDSDKQTELASDLAWAYFDGGMIAMGAFGAEGAVLSLFSYAKGGVSRSVGALRTALSSFVKKGAGKEVGILRNAAKGKGNFGLGSGTRTEADKIGKAWVGDGYKVASHGKTLISKDSLKQYRPPSYKPRLDKTQANFEQRFPGQQSNRWQSNDHLDITD